MGGLCGSSNKEEVKKEFNPSVYRLKVRPVADKEKVKEILKNAPCFCHNYNDKCSSVECASLRVNIENIGYMGLDYYESKYDGIVDWGRLKYLR